MNKLLSYWIFDRFINNFDNDFISTLSKSIVLELFKMGILDSSFISLDSTPIKANTSLNNPKSFKKNKFAKTNQPSSDKDCALGVHTATNQINERNYNFYWGYKNHVLIDCITGLPIFEMTTQANVADSSVALDILNQTNTFLPLNQCTFIADKVYDVKAIYKMFMMVSVLYHLILEIQKKLKNFLLAIRFVMLVLLCGKMVLFPIITVLAKSFVVP